MPMATQNRATGDYGKSIATTLTLCTVYIVTSAGLIDFNKYLVSPSRFPYPMALCTMHMLVSTVCCGIMYLIHPDSFPAMELTRGRKLELVKLFWPLGIFFTIALYGSNAAYIYCSVAFLQFMKEANVVIVFLMACATGLQVLSRTKLAVIAWIICGATMAVHGELNFVWIGFAMQAVSQVGACANTVFTEWLFTRRDLKLDPLTYTFFMAPVTVVFLLAGNWAVWDPAVLQGITVWWRYLIPNSLLAFALNVVGVTVIKECSSVGFILTGLVKDIVIVAGSAAIFGDVISPQQVVGFCVTLFGVFFWSYMRIAPDSKTVRGLEWLTGGKSVDGEARSLLASKAV